MKLEEFYAEDERRRRSPEWDYGVMWRQDETVGFTRHWRVSWIVATGEVYAIEMSYGGPVELLGVVPRVGEYPYNRAYLYDAWTKFKNDQPIEQVMEGWAEEPHRPLQWVRDRIAALEDGANLEAMDQTEQAWAQGRES